MNDHNWDPQSKKQSLNKLFFLYNDYYYHKQEICFSQPCGIPRLQASVQRPNLLKISNPYSWSTLLNVSKISDRRLFVHVFVYTTTNQFNNTYRSSLQPENNWPRLRRIFHSIWTFIKPPKHVRFCDDDKQQHNKAKKNCKY